MTKESPAIPTDESSSNDEPQSASTTNAAGPPRKQENVFLNLALNVAIPSLLMTKGKQWFELNPAMLLVVALMFPIAYGLYDFVTRKKYNFFSVLGFVSILITGGVGLLNLDKDWIAIKEAAIPALFGIAVLVSLKTPFPLVRTFLYNPDIFDVPKIESALSDRHNHAKFERLMVQCTMYLVASFVLSAVLNYVLAKYFIRSETGTDEFVKEVGRMTFWSWFFIVIPTMAVTFLALLKLLKGIKTLTDYELEDVMLAAQDHAKSDAAKSDAAKSDAAETEASESPAQS